MCGQMRINALRTTGRRLTAWPVRVTYLPVTETPTEVLIWAPKSLFRRAVQRNRLRRLMREAWRLKQHDLQGTYQLAFTYMDREMQPYAVVAKGIEKAIRKLNHEAHTEPDKR